MARTAKRQVKRIVRNEVPLLREPHHLYKQQHRLPLLPRWRNKLVAVVNEHFLCRFDAQNQPAGKQVLLLRRQKVAPPFVRFGEKDGNAIERQLLRQNKIKLKKQINVYQLGHPLNPNPPQKRLRQVVNKFLYFQPLVRPLVNRHPPRQKPPLKLQQVFLKRATPPHVGPLVVPLPPKRARQRRLLFVPKRRHIPLQLPNVAFPNGRNDAHPHPLQKVRLPRGQKSVGLSRHLPSPHQPLGI